MIFVKGDRVITPGGTGTVIYSRMKASAYNEVAAYSVALDMKVEEQNHPPFPSYNGTVYSAELVHKEEV